MKKSDSMPEDEESSDLYEDPILAALDRELGSVLSSTDNRLVIFLVALVEAVHRMWS